MQQYYRRRTSNIAAKPWLERFGTGLRMLSPRIRVLLVGDDLDCLINHAKALSKPGIQAIISDPDELNTHVGAEGFNLVILCHTLSDLKRRIAGESAHSRWPQVKLIQLLSSTGDFTSLGCALDDAIQDNSREMLEHIMSLMENSASVS
jgi:hypothetical protein